MDTKELNDLMEATTRLFVYSKISVTAFSEVITAIKEELEKARELEKAS